MAGKPDLSVSPQQQPPGVQNVVVYVSNDNFAQAYAVNHQQNVAAAAFTSQGSATPISQQNGGTLAYAATEAATTATTGVSPMAPMAPMAKNILSKAPENNQQHNFYTTPNVPNVITQNGFTYHNHLNSVPVLNTVNANNFDTSSAVKNVISFSASPSPGGTSEIYSLTSDNKQQNVQVFAAQTDKSNNIQVQFAPVNNSEKHNNTSSVHNIQNRSEISVQNSKDIVGSETTYITTENGNFVAVMGAEVAGNQNVVFPRCDSVRSETAESSCSSLSSGDSPVVESSGSVVLMPNGSATNNVTNSGEVLMYDNSAVSVSVRPGQTLGNLVLTMVPPPSGAGTASVASGVPVVGTVQQHTTQQPTSVTVPLGWKRIITNGMVIYIR